MRNKGVDFKIAPPKSHETVGIVECQMREVNKYFIKNGQVHKWWMHTQDILDLLNNTPRQVLDWNTPIGKLISTSPIIAFKMGIKAQNGLLNGMRNLGVKRLRKNEENWKKF